MNMGHCLSCTQTLYPSIILLSPTDGARVANSTSIDSLLDKDFQLLINDAVYNIHSPERGKATLSQNIGSLNSLRDDDDIIMNAF